MSIEHLKLLRDSLEKSKWEIREELPGNDYEISGIWKVSRPNGDSEFNLLFEGLDDLEVLSMEKSYACHVQNNKEFGVYFGKIGKSFQSELANFVEGLARENS